MVTRTQRFLGIDIGAETVKVLELLQDGSRAIPGRRVRRDHLKDPLGTIRAILSTLDWGQVSGAAVTGRMGRNLDMLQVPLRQALARGWRSRDPEDLPTTIVSIGSHGFSVLELHTRDLEVFRENSRCSQGTGNFLRQLVERFDMSIEEASALCASEASPSPLSGRCPVILKTDMTHLANTGGDRSRILAGLFDAVAENVEVLVKPRLSPPRVALVGGVSQSPRIRAHFRDFLARSGMEILALEGDDALFMEALGCAVVASESPASRLPALDHLVVDTRAAELERLPALSASLPMVRRMVAEAPPLGYPQAGEGLRRLLLGLDIGSTGSKIVALDQDSGRMVWQAYGQTLGDPLGAARGLVERFARGPWAPCEVMGFGVTGSGREIVGSLLRTCYGVDAVHVLNEIAAHAEGALHHDPRVDTIFEIGGQDAKYIRLADGRVVDAAMNEACSAGTGSFIEEQGRRFANIHHVSEMGPEAMAAPAGVSLGQHCSVFMAEVIDEAVAQGVDQREILAGIHDSVVQNYLNRVKGSRTVGKVIFCQGMPFASDALAAAVARQTGSEVVIPPDPGMTGALGIALLTRETLARAPSTETQALDLARFLGARVESRETFACKSTAGCGGAGNKCRIDRIATVVAGEKGRFTWGGACSLHDRGLHRHKLPDQSPDPFREREEQLEALEAKWIQPRDRRGRRVGITDEFMMKALFPFFGRFLHELGMDLVIRRGGDHATLRRGIEEANVAFCAPVQMAHGIFSALADADIDILFMPMLRSLPRVGDETHAVVCPMVQAAPDLYRWDLGDRGTRIVSPVIDFGFGNLRSIEFQESCREVARSMGVDDEARWRLALEAGIREQEEFDRTGLAIGRRALEFSRKNGVPPVVVLGRQYTIYNRVLNSNVPAILREQGAMAIPVDCLPIGSDVPFFRRTYWGYGQRNMRAATWIRKNQGVYGLWASNYACGPDSFNLHYFAWVMDGRPYAVIETDGHSGDAGTRTRVEAFLHCCREDQRSDHPQTRPMQSLSEVERATTDFPSIGVRRDTVLIPRMGAGAEAVAACLRGFGVPAECLPMPDREALRLGRRHTSGKECVPMTITLGSLLQRLAREPDPSRTFAFFMPKANGPCRFGSYHVLHQIVIRRLHLQDRVRIWSPEDQEYFRDIPAGLGALLFMGFMGMDLLQEALYDVRPAERVPGGAQRAYDAAVAELLACMEQEAGGDLSSPRILREVVTGRLFGVAEILGRHARSFAGLKTDRRIPTVLVVGEIYVRCDPFANSFVIEELERRGIRSRFAPFNEWLEYVDHLYGRLGQRRKLGSWLGSRFQDIMRARSYGVVARELGWPERSTDAQSIAASAPYLRDALRGEAVLTLGGPIHEWRKGLIDGTVSVNPLECMPGKIAEAQFHHVARREGLPSLSLSVNGEPLDAETLDSFAFQVRSRFEGQGEARQTEGMRDRLLRLGTGLLAWSRDGKDRTDGRMAGK